MRMLLPGKSGFACGSQRDESTEPVTAWLGCLSSPVSAGSGAEGAPRALLSHLGWSEEVNWEPPQRCPHLGSPSHPPRVDQEFVLLKHIGWGGGRMVFSFEMEAEPSVKDEEHGSGPEPWREGWKAAESDPRDRSCAFRDWGCK